MEESTQEVYFSEEIEVQIADPPPDPKEKAQQGDTQAYCTGGSRWCLAVALATVVVVVILAIAGTARDEVVPYVAAVKRKHRRTKEPTFTPTEFPSERPSSIPSLLPSATPTEFPSDRPSSIPSLLPSASPSHRPSVCSIDATTVVNKNFGNSVAIYGDTAVIGAAWDDENGRGSGAVYVFHILSRNGGVTYEQEAKILPNDGVAGDAFGVSVAVYNNTFVVGAALNSNSGAAYVFTRNGMSEWVQQAKLMPNDGGDMDFFGWSVAIYEDTIVVGADEEDDGGKNSGAAYIFDRSGASWLQQAKILPDKVEAYSHFGYSTALHKDTVVIGTRYSSFDTKGTNGSKAYIFVRNETMAAWYQQAMLLSEDDAAHDRFGWSVGVYENTAVVGAPLSSNAADESSSSGAVYIFIRNDTWAQEAKILPDGGDAFDTFGIKVALYDDNIIIGASRDDDGGSDAGAVYLFTRNIDPTDGTTIWEQDKFLIGRAAGDTLGSSVDLHDKVAIIGAPEADINGTDSGAVYLVDLC